MADGDALHNHDALLPWEKLRYEAGTGHVEIKPDKVRLVIGAQNGEQYSDAQLDDYHGDGVMRWQPPVCLSLRARVSHAPDALRGTCGFGFWNDPLGVTTTSNFRWLPRLQLPQAVWFFFAAPPSNLPWAYDLPGVGWKAATLDASGWLVRLLLPFAPLGMLLCRWRPAYVKLWPWLQKLMKIDERPVASTMNVWHDFRLVWGAGEVSFWMDRELILRTARSPRGPLGLVIWIDNQFMVATPQGALRHGCVATGEQWLEVTALKVTRLEAVRD